MKWALERGGLELERAVRREFAELANQARPARNTLSSSDDDLLRHGIVPDAMREAIRAQAIAQVILACSRALFATEVLPRPVAADRV